jgi:hypothetical protein
VPASKHHADPDPSDRWATAGGPNPWAGPLPPVRMSTDHHRGRPPAHPEPMGTYDISVQSLVGEALWALLAEWDLDGLTVELVIRGARLRPGTLTAIRERAPALGVTVIDAQIRQP